MRGFTLVIIIIVGIIIALVQGKRLILKDQIVGMKTATFFERRK